MSQEGFIRRPSIQDIKYTEAKKIGRFELTQQVVPLHSQINQLLTQNDMQRQILGELYTLLSTKEMQPQQQSPTTELNSTVVSFIFSLFSTYLFTLCRNPLNSSCKHINGKTFYYKEKIK